MNYTYAFEWQRKVWGVVPTWWWQMTAGTVEHGRLCCCCSSGCCCWWCIMLSKVWNKFSSWHSNCPKWNRWRVGRIHVGWKPWSFKCWGVIIVSILLIHLLLWPNMFLMPVFHEWSLFGHVNGRFLILFDQCWCWILISSGDKTLPRTITRTTIMLLMFFRCKKLEVVICVNKHLMTTKRISWLASSLVDSFSATEVSLSVLNSLLHHCTFKIRNNCRQAVWKH